MSIKSAVLYVDGACKGNPGVGGWGVHIQYPDATAQDFCGGAQHSTNNQMELTAAIEGLQRTADIPSVTIWTDSNYVVQGITQWISGWKSKNWRKADGSPVSNQELWLQLDQACQGRQIDWRWIKGHAGHAGNERADALANQGVEQLLSGTSRLSQLPTADWLTHDPLGLDAINEDGILEDEPETGILNSAAEEDQLNFEPLPLPDDLPIDHHDAADVFDALSIVAQDQRAEATSAEERAQYGNLTNAQVAVSTQKKPAVAADWHAPKRTSHGHRQLILDTETTGINPLTERVIEIGVIEMINRKATGNSLHVYLNPDQPVGDSEAIHGISDAFLQDKMRFAQIAQDLCDFLVGGEIIAHNASFDMNFLEAELRRCGLPALAGHVQVTDTLAMAKRKHAGQKNSLDALARRYEITPRDRTYHGALLDAEILADVYLAMTGGQVILDMQPDGHTGDQPRRHRRFGQHMLTIITASADDLRRHEQWVEQHATAASLWQ